MKMEVAMIQLPRDVRNTDAPVSKAEAAPDSVSAANDVKRSSGSPDHAGTTHRHADTKHHHARIRNRRADSSARFVARVALMVSLALIFSYVEAIIPYNPGIPGIKLGVANIVTVVALYKFGWKEAISVSVIRVIIAGLLFSGVFGMLYSLAGAALSLAGMILLKKTGVFSVTGVSMAAGVLHNLGQLLIAAALIEDLRIFFYYPVLLFSGLAAGILVGIAAAIIIRTLRTAV